MVASLPDLLASGVNIVRIMGGVNDPVNNIPFATSVANLQQCIETVLGAGMRVLFHPIPPRGVGWTSSQTVLAQRMNNDMRRYIAGLPAANARKNYSVILSDASGLLTDGTYSTTSTGYIYPVGGAGGVANAVTQDALHQNHRGACAHGYSDWQALQQSLITRLGRPARTYGMFQGWDPVANPAGNRLEGLPWLASTAVTIPALCTNSGNTYYLVTAGTTASSGGPTGTGSSITDGSAVWAYVNAAGRSVGMGTAGTLTSAGSVTCSGTFPSGWALTRAAGSAAGTIIGSIESGQWSDGTYGQRGVLSFSLGSGTTNESWTLSQPFNVMAQAGLTTADLGVTAIYPEFEIELSSVTNMTVCMGQFQDANGKVYILVGPSATGAGAHMPNSSGECILLPGRWVMRGTKYLIPAAGVLPTDFGKVNLNLNFGFDASGGAGSATAVVKVNYAGIITADVI
jgi:hypothetical protein